MQHFFKKFECRRGALSILRDFFFSMSQQFQQSLRIDTFLTLCECNCLKTRLNLDVNEVLRKNKLLFKIYSLPSTCSLYLEMAFSLKRLKSNESVYFMPNDDHNSNYLLKKAEAEEFAQRMFSRLLLSDQYVLECMAKFDRVVKTDLAVRVVHNKVTAEDENDKNRYISFDSLIE